MFYYNVYTNYEHDVNGEYDVVACCEVSHVTNVPKDVYSHTILAGKYARFDLEGDVKEVMPKFWQEFWTMSLDRKYTSDFEEYRLDRAEGDTKMSVYISLND